MMKTAIHRAWLLGLSAALGGCGSTVPLQFYTLVPAAEPPQAPAPGYAIEVLPIQVPAQVDVPELVVRRGETEVALAENRQWIAPLGAEVRAALVARLIQELGAEEVYGRSVAEDQRVFRIRVELRRFDSWPDRAAEIEASWMLSRVGERLALNCTSRWREPVEGVGYGALVAAHQRALQRLGTQIAAAVAHWQAGAPPRCDA